MWLLGRTRSGLLSIMARVFTRPTSEARAGITIHLNTVYGSIDRENRQEISMQLPFPFERRNFEWKCWLPGGKYLRTGSPAGWNSVVILHLLRLFFQLEILWGIIFPEKSHNGMSMIFIDFHQTKKPPVWGLSFCLLLSNGLTYCLECESRTHRKQKQWSSGKSCCFLWPPPPYISASFACNIEISICNPKRILPAIWTIEICELRMDVPVLNISGFAYTWMAYCR